MIFAWVYIEGPSVYKKRGTIYELEYSVKSVRKFFPEAKCVVFGDKPSFEVDHVQVDKIPADPGAIDVRHKDIINKLEVIADYCDEFVLMYDDVYFLKPITPGDLQTHYALCSIPDLEQYARKGSMLYTRLWRNTYKKVSELIDNLVDWETHLPRYMTSERVRYLIDKYDLFNNNLLITSLYPAIFADWYKLLSETKGVRGYIDQMGPSVDLEMEFDNKFLILNDNAYTPSVIKKLLTHID